MWNRRNTWPNYFKTVTGGHVLKGQLHCCLDPDSVDIYIVSCNVESTYRVQLMVSGSLNKLMLRLETEMYLVR
jgi:hypothetical protein